LQYWPRSVALIARQQFGCGSSARFILKINIRQILAVAVFDDKAGVQFFDGPGPREAAGRARAGLALLFPQELRQFGDVGRTPPRLVFQTFDC
jgi:hypothetical protein